MLGDFSSSTGFILLLIALSKRKNEMRNIIGKIPKISKFLAIITAMLVVESITIVILATVAFIKKDISMTYMIIFLSNSITLFACLIILIKQDLKLKK